MSYDNMSPLHIVSIVIIIGLVIYFFTLIYKHCYLYPKLKKELETSLNKEESILKEKTNDELQFCKNWIDSLKIPLAQTIVQNYCDNLYRLRFEDLYHSRSKDFCERPDFSKPYVQIHYKINEKKVQKIEYSHPHVPLNLECLSDEISPAVLKAYRKMVSAYTALTLSNHIQVNGKSFEFDNYILGQVSIDNRHIPSFTNEKGEILFIYPTFILLCKLDEGFEVFEFDKLHVHLEAYRMFWKDQYKAPHDSIAIDESWEHMKIDGKPDARYANNAYYLWYNYGKLLIHVFALNTSFFSHHFYISNYKACVEFELSINHLLYTVLESKNTIIDDQSKSLPPLSKLVLCSYYFGNLSNPWKFSVFDIDRVDSLFIEVAKYAIATKSTSASSIQRHFDIDYHRTVHILDEMEAAEIINRGSSYCLRTIKFTKKQFNDWIIFQSACKKENACKKETTNENKSPSATALNELNSLIGLKDVKEEITKLQDFIKIQLIRKKQGLKLSPISYHCVFTGNPGTGKTTVARIVAEIYKELGVLKKGHLIETDRSGLVAEYIGQTAIKTNNVIDSALDGVLFIDEAYSLVVKESPQDFGPEAIATLLKRMEDDRDRLVVILAGYNDEMKGFINSNPGLQSRFNRYIHFDDYNAEDLMSIFELNLKKHQYIISESAKELLNVYFENAVLMKDRNFGNGRFVRNLFEKILQLQASRLSKLSNHSKTDLQLIVDEDIPRK